MENKFFCDEKTIVETTKGKLRGFYYDGIYNFHGIRYAKAKRFQAPLPVKSWEGVKDACSYGFISPVLDNPRPMGEVKTPHRFWPENENCQYLNVWTKEINDNAKKPVMVWLHGGGFSAGSSIEQVCYEGGNLAKEEVVVVSINHRLNAFGFMDLSSFGEKYANSCNAGMADIVAALQWIHDNIKGFGGDPENVTIFGQSGGGGKVMTLGQIPAAEGLYHKAIVMSGVIGDDAMAMGADPVEFANEVRKELKIENQNIEELERVPTPLFIMAVNKASKTFMAKGQKVGWSPKANDWYVGSALSGPSTDYFCKVPTMVGSVMAEFSLEAPVYGKEELSAAKRRENLAQKYGEENVDEVIRLFKAAYPDKNEVYARYMDLIFRPNTLNFIKKKAEESQAPVYSYLFALEFDIDGGTAAWHCSDIPFFFHNVDLIPLCQMYGEESKKLEAQMAGAFLNFARTGNPNHSLLPQWKASTGTQVNTMIFDKECRVQENFDEELITYLNKITPPFHFDPSMFADEEEEGNAWVF